MAGDVSSGGSGWCWARRATRLVLGQAGNWLEHACCYAGQGKPAEGEAHGRRRPTVGKAREAHRCLKKIWFHTQRKADSNPGRGARGAECLPQGPSIDLGSLYELNIFN